MTRIVDEGLSSREAGERLLRDGPNALPTQQRRGPWGIALEVTREPMFAMLVVGAALYLALGETGDGLLLLAAVVMVIGLTLYHERRTDRALAALAELSSPRALEPESSETVVNSAFRVAKSSSGISCYSTRAIASLLMRSCAAAVTSLSMNHY